jgi:hypothetical protein
MTINGGGKPIEIDDILRDEIKADDAAFKCWASPSSFLKTMACVMSQVIVFAIQLLRYNPFSRS